MCVTMKKIRVSANLTNFLKLTQINEQCNVLLRTLLVVIFVAGQTTTVLTLSNEYFGFIQHKS